MMLPAFPDTFRFNRSGYVPASILTLDPGMAEDGRNVENKMRRFHWQRTAFAQPFFIDTEKGRGVYLDLCSETFDERSSLCPATRLLPKGSEKFPSSSGSIWASFKKK
jgi:hypothetical protein